jgi:adenylosuccinate synthase
MNVIVVGAQWGDEGKGKVVDLYSAKADYIVRYQGGNNAGHTLVVNGKKTVLRLIPSGILHPGKICLIANGVVFDPENFFDEIGPLEQSGAFRTVAGAPLLASDVVRVSERAHVILPYHRLIDQLREVHAANSPGEGKIGTTGRGIGPAYEDKVARRGVQVIDLLRPDVLRAKLERAIEEKNILLRHHFDAPLIELEPLLEQCVKIGERLRPYVTDVRGILVQAMARKNHILFEGAQGTLLDVDHGTYPFVTSSNTVAGGALTGSGIGPSISAKVIGITKAYTTRVGSGPFPTELEAGAKAADPELAERIRKIGKEFGAVTGRSRRCGWLDLVALKYAVEVNGITGLALTKADVLQNFDCVKVCTSYRLGGNTLYELPSSGEDLENVEPAYEILPGWGAYDPKEVHTIEDLPQELREYMRYIEDFLHVPIVLMSTGPAREETLVIADPFET